MSAATWWMLALLVLAAGVALLGLGGWVRGSREARTSATLQTALRPRDAAPPEPAPARDSFGWLQQLGQLFAGGRLEAALLANEDRLLLDLAGLNAQTVDLQLKIVTAQILNTAIVEPARHIAGFIDPRLRIVTERIGDKAFCRQRRKIKIAARQLNAANIQFTPHASWQQLSLPIKNI